MLTINQLRGERFRAIRAIQRALKPVDTQIELIQRSLTRILNRKRDMPTAEDVEILLTESHELLARLDNYDKAWVQVSESGVFPEGFIGGLFESM